VTIIDLLSNSRKKDYYSIAFLVFVFLFTNYYEMSLNLVIVFFIIIAVWIYDFFVSGTCKICLLLRWMFYSIISGIYIVFYTETKLISISTVSEQSIIYFHGCFSIWLLISILFSISLYRRIVMDK